MIESQNISYTLGTKTILDTISSTINDGTITCILGANGAGKSTYLQCLTGAVTPTSGTILFNHKKLTSYSVNELAKKRAVLSQTTNIAFPFSVIDIALMGRNPHIASNYTKEDLDITKQALAAMDVYHLKDRICNSLSGGEQQRVHLARIFAQIWDQQNATIFLDEPTSAQDLKYQYVIIDFIKTLKDQGHTTVAILHDLNLVTQLADQLLLLQKGQLVVQGSPRNILTPQAIASLYDIDSNISSTISKKLFATS